MNRVYDTVTKKCICKDGYFDNSGVCEPCLAECKTCSNNTTCDTCEVQSISNRSLVGARCKCIDGTFDTGYVIFIFLVNFSKYL